MPINQIFGAILALTNEKPKSLFQLAVDTEKSNQWNQVHL